MYIFFVHWIYADYTGAGGNLHLARYFIFPNLHAAQVALEEDLGAGGDPGLARTLSFQIHK